MVAVLHFRIVVFVTWVACRKKLEAAGTKSIKCTKQRVKVSGLVGRLFFSYPKAGINISDELDGTVNEFELELPFKVFWEALASVKTK